MSGRQGSARRTAAGLVLAIFVAPVMTAFSIELVVLLTRGVPARTLADEIGGTLTFLVTALVFGGVLAAVPVLVLGSLAVAIARVLGTRSPVFYAVAGFLGAIAWRGWTPDARRAPSPCWTPSRSSSADASVP